MRPFFSFYGAKWRDAALYPEPRFETIVEPFAGSAGYSVRHPEHKVILCEIDPIVAGVWRYLISVSSEEILRLPDLELEQTTADLNVPQEARWLIGFWVNRAPASPRSTPSAWMRSGIRPGSFWGDRVRNTIASQVDGIRHWRIIEGSYESLDRTRPATWFLDPPYQNQGRHYRFGSKQIDFPALGRWTHTLPGQTIVCEQEGADWLPFRPLASTKTTRPTRSAEVIWGSDFV